MVTLEVSILRFCAFSFSTLIQRRGESDIPAASTSTSEEVKQEVVKKPSAVQTPAPSTSTAGGVKKSAVIKAAVLMPIV